MEGCDEPEKKKTKMDNEPKNHHQAIILRHLNINDVCDLSTQSLPENVLATKMVDYMEANLSLDDSVLNVEILQFLGVFLQNKKLAVDFIRCQGLPQLLKYSHFSINNATYISVCLHLIAKSEEAMKLACKSSGKSRQIATLVRCVLSLLECSIKADRLNATKFLCVALQFRPFLEEFDAQDGIHHLCVNLNRLPIISLKLEPFFLFKDEEIKYITEALKLYFRIHLKLGVKYGSDRDADEMYQLVMSAQEPADSKLSDDWPPVKKFILSSGIPALREILGASSHWDHKHRPEVVRNILDVLVVCSISKQAQTEFCEWIDWSFKLPPNADVSLGIKILLCAAKGDLVPDPQVKRSALAILIAWLPATIPPAIDKYQAMQVLYSSKSKKATQSQEEICHKVWRYVVRLEGIPTLIDLLTITTPKQEADSIRLLACKALLKLSLYEEAKKIIQGHYFFTGELFKYLLKEPVIPANIQLHTEFQRIGFNLVKQIWEADPSKSNILLEFQAMIENPTKVANEVTKGTSNKERLGELKVIHEQLLSFNLVKTANLLLEEADVVIPAFNANYVNGFP